MKLRPVYYNENWPDAVAWLQNNIDAGLVAFGHIDFRSIKDVTPNDLAGYAQVHLFAGIGGWSIAARMAGWHDARPLWSASCPCQPYSAAGLGRGTDDPRHLWPDVYRLLGPTRPPVIVGEQVAGAAGYGWFDGVRADLETSRYANGVVDIAACAVDSPQQRQRLYWLGILLSLANGEGERGRAGLRGSGPAERGRLEPANCDAIAGGPGALDGADQARRERHGGHGDGIGVGPGPAGPTPAPDDGNRQMVDGSSERWGEGLAQPRVFGRWDAVASSEARSAVANSHGPRSTAHGRDAGEVGGIPEGEGQPSDGPALSRGSDGAPIGLVADRREPVGLADSDGQGRAERDIDAPARLGASCGADPDGCDMPEPDAEALDSAGGVGWASGGDGDGRHVGNFSGAGNQHGRNGSWWAGAEWIYCHDQKARRVADASAPLLVDGVRGGVPVHRPDCIRVERLPGGAAHPLAADVRIINRVAAWSGFGNAIVPVLAAEHLGALMDILPPWTPE